MFWVRHGFEWNSGGDSCCLVQKYDSASKITKYIESVIYHCVTVCHCGLSYIDETKLKFRLKEHERCVKNQDTKYCVVSLLLVGLSF